jgi:hypothetical protein
VLYTILRRCIQFVQILIIMLNDDQSSVIEQRRKALKRGK